MICPCHDPVAFGHLWPSCPDRQLPYGGYAPWKACPVACFEQHGIISKAAMAVHAERGQMSLDLTGVPS